jgi:hypothetical protein
MSDVFFPLLILQGSVTASLAGLFWIIDLKRFSPQTEKWARQVGAALMLAELMSAIALFFYISDPLQASLLRISVLILMGIWMTTVMGQLPDHIRPRIRFDTVCKLLWTIRFILLIFLIGMNR